MLKNLLVPAFMLVLLLPASAQHKRRVLIEEFTNASCGPCAAQNPTFNATVDANAQYLTPIKYQTNWPGVDPMNAQTQSEVGPRVTYYGVTGVPNGRQNGTLEVFPMTSYNAATIQAAYNTLTPVTITVTHELTAGLDSILVHISVTSDADLAGTLRLRAAVTEKAIVFDAAPGTNGEKEFFQVMRKMLPNSSGTTTGNFAAGETKSYEFAWPLNYIYDLNQISAVAWLQDDATKEVYQSEISEPIGGIPAVGIKVASLNTFACTATDIPYFNMTNTADAPLTSASLRYKVGNGATKDLDWTGNIAPGVTERIDLTDETISPSGLTAVTVEVLGSNNGIQTNMVSSTSTVNFKALLVAPSPVPVTTDFQSVVFPPAGWTTFNAGSQGWKLVTGYGAGGSTRSARCDMYNIGAGATPTLVTPKIDLSQSSGLTVLKFDHAYAYYDNTFYDSLRIEVSTDCGLSWTTVFHNGKDGLATTTPKTANYVPSANDWVADEVDLSAFNGSESVLVRFIAESGFGNNLYIDNINISTVTGVKELSLSDFSLQPNPTRDLAQVRFSLVNPGSVRLLVLDAAGALVQSRELGDLVSGDHVVDLDATSLTSGSYRVVLQSQEGVAQMQWVVIR